MAARHATPAIGLAHVTVVPTNYRPPRAGVGDAGERDERSEPEGS